MREHRGSHIEREARPGASWGQVALLLLAILFGAVAGALPAIVTGDERCLLVRSWDCRFWWLP